MSIDDCRLLEHGGLVCLIFGGNPDLSGMIDDGWIEELKNIGTLGSILKDGWMEHFSNLRKSAEFADGIDD